MSAKKLLTIPLVAATLLSPLLDHWLTREAIVRSLVAAGAARVEVTTAFLNPFTGELAVDGLRVTGGGGEESALRRLRAEVAWGPLLERRLSLRSVQLEGVQLTISDAAPAWRIGGLALPGAPDEPASPEGAWRLAVGVMTLKEADLRIQRNGDLWSLRVERALASGFAGLESERPTVVEAEGSLDDAPLRLHGRLIPAARRFEGELNARGIALAPLSGGRLSAGRGALDGGVTLTLGEGIELHHRGAITVTGAALPLEGGEQRFERLAWRGESRLAPRRVELDGRLEGRGLRLTLPDPTRVDLQGLTWNGRLEAGGLDAESPRIIAQGTLEGRDLAATTADGHRLAQERFAWTGEAWLEGGRPSAAGTLGVERTRVERAATTLLACDTLKLEGLSLADERSTASAIRAEGLVLLRGEGAENGLAEVGGITAQRLTHSPDQGIELSAAKLDRLRLRLIRDAGGRLAMATEQGSADRGEGTPPALRIGRLEVGGGSRIDFQDHALTPPRQFHVGLERLTLTDLDGRAPRQPAKLDLVATVGDYTRVETRGTLTPFAHPVGLRLDGHVDALDLPPLSGYTAEALGYNLSSGQMDADFELTLDQGALAGVGRITAHNLAVEATDPTKMATMNQEMAIPLESALALLRDDRGDVRLTLPVSGSLDDPRFDLGDAINQAVGKAMRTAAVGYLKLALQPFGALVTLVEVAGKAAAQVRLDPLPFPPGEAALPPAATGYLDKIDALLQERPQLRLRLCGYAGEGDREALIEKDRKRGGEAPAKESAAAGEERLLALATERSEAVKHYLSGERGTDPKRLFLCLPQWEEKGDPRVELTI